MSTFRELNNTSNWDTTETPTLCIKKSVKTKAYYKMTRPEPTKDDRHSHNPKTSCCNHHSEKKNGHGKGNWGVPGSELDPVVPNPSDPTYDSDEENTNQKK